MWFNNETIPQSSPFYRCYVYPSQSWVVYGIVLTTLVTINDGIIPPFIVYFPIFSHMFPYFLIFFYDSPWFPPFSHGHGVHVTLVPKHSLAELIEARVPLML